MNRNASFAVCLVVILSLPFAPLTVPLTDAADDPSTVDPVKTLENRLDQYNYDRPPSVDQRVEVVVKMENGTDIPKSNEFVIERVYTDEGHRFMRGSIPMSNVRALATDSQMRAVRITSDQPIHDGRIASGVNRINADSLHSRDIRGENVTVGVIDSDFRISHPAIAQSVGAYHVLGNTSTGASNWRHGTAVASVVIDTAPNVELHLASIGPTTTPKEYAAAVKWLQQSGADIILDAGSYYAQPGDGTGKIAQIAANASSETVFVTSTGNHAQRYWAGNYSSSGDKWVTIHNETKGNLLNNGKSFSGTVSLTLRWDSWPNTATNYDLYLLRKHPGPDTVVAKATGHNGRPFEYLKTSVPNGKYYVSIQVVTGPKQGNTSHLELFANRELRFQSHGGSVAPANARGVLSVGASENGTVEPFSARGADIAAPDTVAIKGITVKGGTSFSAPYVAGTAALILSSNPGLTTEEVRILLKATADDIGQKGVDSRSGYGRVNATRAVKAANILDNGFKEPTTV